MASDSTEGEGAGWSGRLWALAIGVALSFGGLVGGGVVAAIGILGLEAAGFEVFGSALLFPVTTVFQGLGFGLVVAAYLAVSDRRGLLKAGFPSVRDLAWTVGGIVALLSAIVVIGAVLSQFDVATARNQIEQVGTENPAVLLYMIPLAFLVIGPGEELLFRGAVQGVLRRAYGPAPAIVLASALFGVAHVAALIGSASGILTYVVVVFLLGAILGVVYERTRNLVVPALVHGAYNAIVFTSLYVRVTGTAPSVPGLV